MFLIVLQRANPLRIDKHLRVWLNQLLLLALGLMASAAQAQVPSAPYAAGDAANNRQPGVTRLSTTPGATPSPSSVPRNPGEPAKPAVDPLALVPEPPGEFESFVQKIAGLQIIKRLGFEFLASEARLHLGEISPLVPPDYIVSSGDEVLITIWGAVEADLQLLVDKAGRISIPRVGTVQVAGLRYQDLGEAITRRVGQTYKNFQVSASLGQLRGIRVFVTGFVPTPGAHLVSGLASLTTALIKAGGPSAAGSFRQIELRRGGKAIAKLDLYDLLLRGDRGSDPVLQPGDIVHVGAVGPQVGVIGSVNRPGVFELLTGETVSDVLLMAGGMSAIADRTRLTIERLSERSSTRIAQLALPGDERGRLASGDILRVLSAVDISLPSDRQSKRVRVEGEVNRPAEYLLPAGSTLADAIKMGGGLTGFAFLYATEFTRESVRLNQRQNYDRALRDLETDLARSSASQRTAGADEAAARSAQTTSANQLVERLKALQPTGRVVLQLAPGAQELPDIALEDGDRIFIPSTPSTVGVSGSVFNAASYLYSTNRTLDDYLQLAGGPTRGADEGSIFVVRANGTVLSRRQGKSGWFSRDDALAGSSAVPGDTIFVPEELNKTTFVQAAKDWTQILYNFGIGLAGIKSAVK